MSDYGHFQRRHQRLAILRHLEAIPEYTGNASILQDVLRGLGLPMSRDQVTSELVWLKEQGFVTFGEVSDFIVVSATGRGIDIARGLASHPDIQRPSPRG